MSQHKELAVDATVLPEGSLELLSRSEVELLLSADAGKLHQRFRKIALAVLNCGAKAHNSLELNQRFPEFRVKIEPTERGIKLALTAAPSAAFVDGVMIRGLRELLFAALRDVLFTTMQIDEQAVFNLDSSEGITNAVFHTLRNANVLNAEQDGKLVVCWGGHAINDTEYDYAKHVGYEMGLRDLNICTGCGEGAMKGPMKGATIAHAKQRIIDGRYLGLTEPGIIAAESPNPIVNQLVILPDIEKRLEAFVRMAHGIVIFPGGVGTAEELLYLLGILLHPDNDAMPMPLVLAAPKESAAYFEQIDNFIGNALGERAQAKYQIIVDDPEATAIAMRDGADSVRAYRKAHGDAFYFNWLLKIDLAFQQTFSPTHENMAGLNLSKNQPAHSLAADLRRAFSGIVAGNVKDDGIAAVQAHGPYQLSGDPQIMVDLDQLLRTFVEQRRMNTSERGYEPCYQVIH
jgi:predicted Rossmann-fold nucleotide-binding protein